MEQNNERQHLLNIFPEEVWMIVFNQMENETDLQNLSNSSPVLRQFLLPRRVLFLSPKVLEILTMKCHHHHNAKFSSNNSNVCLILTNENCLDNSHNWKKGILNLRLVCRSWTKSIDNFYQNTFKNQSIEFYWNRDFPNSRHFLQTNLTDSRNHNKFFRYFKPTHNAPNKNPFFTRSVIIGDIVNLRDHHQEEPGIWDLLLAYGHHIWFCVIELSNGYQSHSECYTILRNCMLSMPNLKVLEINYNAYLAVDFDDIKEEILYRSMPKLKDLNLIRAFNLPTLIFKELFRTNCHITKLKMERVYGIMDEYELFKTTLPKLMEFSIAF